MQGYYIINSVNNLINFNFAFLINLLQFLFNIIILCFDLLFYNKFYVNLSEPFVRVINSFVFKGKCVGYVIIITDLVCFMNISIYLMNFCHNDVTKQTFILFFITVWTGSNDPMNEA